MLHSSDDPAPSAHAEKESLHGEAAFTVALNLKFQHSDITQAHALSQAGRTCMKRSVPFSRYWGSLSCAHLSSPLKTYLRQSGSSIRKLPSFRAWMVSLETIFDT